MIKENTYKRIDEALEEARANFWQSIVKHFPEMKSGDIEPIHLDGFDRKTRSAVINWVDMNQPNDCEMIQELEELGFPSIAEGFKRNEYFISDRGLLFKDIEQAKKLDDYNDEKPYERALLIVETLTANYS